MAFVARDKFMNYRTHRFLSCITDLSIKFMGMCTLIHDISFSFLKKDMTDLHTGYVEY